MPQARLQDRAETTPRRDRILEETLRIVGERGYHGFGIQELAERCGLTKPGLLHHFGSKDQLLIALLNEVDARDEAELGALFAAYYEQPGEPAAHRDTFRRSLLMITGRTLERPELIRLRVVLRAEAINPGHPAHAYFAAREVAALARLTTGATAFSSHPQSTARQVMALMAGLEQQWLRAGGTFDLVAEVDRALELLLRV